MDREALIHFMSGAIGGTVATCLTCPLEVVKHRMQSSAYKKSRNAEFFKQILRREGITAMFKGLTPNLLGITPTKAIYFYTYSTCKRLFNNTGVLVPNSAMTHMLSAGLAGFITSTVTNPVWLVKTRLQLRQGPLTVRGCIRDTYRNDGIKGFYKGVTASYFGISETIIQFVLYEYFRTLINEAQFSQESTRFASLMFAGGVSKFIACAIAYPHEVVKTRLREENSRANGFCRTFVNLFREGGLRLLYRGISMQLLHSVPNTAITMGTYEVAVHFLHKYADASHHCDLPSSEHQNAVSVNVDE